MFTFKGVLPLAAILVCTSFVLGCSGGGAIAITLNPSSTATINQAQTQAIIATLTNDKTNQGVTWSLGTSVGTLTGQTKTAVTYVAPPVVSTTTTATVTATSVANSAITASLTITINPVLTIATPSLPVGTQNSPYFGVISATGGSGTFTWTLTSGSLPAGLTLSSSTSSAVTISGTPTATGTSKFTVQVTVGASTATQALSITINPPPPLSVGTKSLPNGTVGVLYSTTLAASSGTAPYTWSVTGLPADGLLSTGTGNNTIYGTPMTAETLNLTVTVTDSSSPVQTATATLSLTINPSTAANAQLNGTYAFLVSGFASTTQYAIAGSLVADGNGNITSGVIDDPENLLSNQAFTGTYLIASNGLGTITLNTSVPRSFSAALTPLASGTTVSTGGKLIECEGSTCGTSGSGVLLQQNTGDFSTSAILGNYAFGFQGADATGGRYAMAGTFNADGVAALNTGFLDSDDVTAGAGSNVAFTGTYSIPTPSVTGRGTATITTSVTTNYCLYVVSKTELLALETDRLSGSVQPLVGGMILAQDTSFGQSSLNGTDVFETTAVNSGTALGQVGLFIPVGTGTMSTSFDQSTGTGTPVTGSGTYTVSTTSNGRVTMTGSGIASPDPILYLVTANEGFFVGTDPGVTVGFMKPQPTPGTFSVASLSGTYAGGSLAPLLSTASDQIDMASSDGVANLTFTTDIAGSSGLSLNQSTSATYTLDSTGRGTETENSSTAAIFYMVSTSEFWSVALNANGMIEIFQQ